MSVRSGPQRTADAIAKLRATDGDVWVSTAPTAGPAHLVPLSYAWNGERLILAAPASSLTVRNIQATGRARLGFGPTRDVVIMDAEVGGIAGVDDPTMAEVGRAFADQADWDPRGSPEYVFVLLRPRHIQAWRDASELSGRLLMHDGRWLFEV
jgi:hypothetical protein